MDKFIYKQPYKTFQKKRIGLCNFFLLLFFILFYFYFFR